MPAFRIPARSGPHRIAAIALCRALLTQCRRLEFAQVQRDELQNLIRNRFKQARRDQGAKRLRVSFDAGYEAIDLLDAAVAGDGESKSRILRLLEDAPAKAKQAPPAQEAPLRKRHMDSEIHSAIATETKPNHSLFDRPLPLSELSGRRHVPVLVSANKIPMLRLKKPQPENLSGYLAHRVRKRQKRHNYKHRLMDEISIADQEDYWDDLIAQAQVKQGVEQKKKSASFEPDWSDALDEDLDRVHRALNEENRKNREMAEKMQEVVDRETALFEKEREQRREQRKQRLVMAQSSSNEGHEIVGKPALER